MDKGILLRKQVLKMLSRNTNLLCEPCGWERYYHINYDSDNKKMFYQQIPQKPVLVPEISDSYSTGKGVYDFAEYNGKLYYLNNRQDKPYLFSSNLDGTNQHVVMSFKRESNKLIMTVNRFGIFLIFLKARKIDVKVYTHLGKEVCHIPIQLSGFLTNTDSTNADYCPYVCDNKLFFIVREKEIYKGMLVELDIDNKIYNSHVIYEGTKQYDGRKGIDAVYNPKFIIGRSDFALVYVTYHYKFGYPNYITVDTSAWNYISLRDGKMYCLSNPRFSPELIKTHPKEYSKYLELIETEKEWIKIAHFDIHSNLIWIYKNMRDSEQNIVRCIVPYDLKPDFMNHPRKDFKIWAANPEIDEVTHSGKYYFDGLFRFSTESYSSFIAYEKSGRKNVWSRSHGNCHCFSVKSNTLFLDGDLSGQPSQFDLNNYVERKSYDGKSERVPKKLREDWTGSGYRLIEQYEKVLKQNNKVADKQRSVNDNFFDDISSVYDDDFRNSLLNRNDNTAQNNKQAKNPDNSNHTETVTSVPAKKTEKTFLPENKLNYWENFYQYLENNPLPVVKKSKPSDRNWYALRLGSSKIRIECSVSTKNQNLRVGFFMENSDSVYGNAALHKKEIDSILKNSTSVLSEIRWDNSIADANVSMFISLNGMDKTNQYKVMRDIISGMIRIMEFIDL